MFNTIVSDRAKQLKYSILSPKVSSNNNENEALIKTLSHSSTSDNIENTHPDKDTTMIIDDFDDDDKENVPGENEQPYPVTPVKNRNKSNILKCSSIMKKKLKLDICASGK